MNLSKLQKEALVSLYTGKIVRSKFKNSTWLALCDKGFATANGFMYYTYIAPEITQEGVIKAKKILKELENRGV